VEVDVAVDDEVAVGVGVGVAVGVGVSGFHRVIEKEIVEVLPSGVVKYTPTE
jgi:hypothetical protein